MPHNRQDIENLRQELRKQHLEQYRKTIENPEKSPSTRFLPRSKKSALLLCIAAYLSFLLVGVLLALITASVTGEIAGFFDRPPGPSDPGMVTAIAAMIVLALVLQIGIGAWFIYGFRYRWHFGKEGLIRWVAYGAILALLFYIQDLLWPSTDSYSVLEHLVKGILGLLAYLIAFGMFQGPKKKIAA